MAPGSGFVLAVVAPSQAATASDSLAKSFSRDAEKHHQPERNPWHLDVRLRVAMAVANEVKTSEPTLPDVLVTAIPRPDRAYETLRLWFPGKRVWVIPNGGEEFDESKERFFLARGDRVLRIPGTYSVRGSHVRAALVAGQMEEFRQSVPSFLWEIYAPGSREK